MIHIIGQKVRVRTQRRSTRLQDRTECAAVSGPACSCSCSGEGDLASCCYLLGLRCAGALENEGGCPAIRSRLEVGLESHMLHVVGY